MDRHPAQPLPKRTCPLCGGPNGCVPAATGSFADPCWCRTVNFSAELLARVPPSEVGRACICRACSGGSAADAEPPAGA